jgi:hypothetical protein
MVAAVAKLGAIGFVLLTACGRFDFQAVRSGVDATGVDDADATPPTAHTSMDSVVDTMGIATTASEGDGSHLVFVDNTPGKNGDLVVFRESDDTTTLKAYVSTDAGATWTRYVLGPANTAGINGMGGCQGVVDHVFHVTWLDFGASDQYVRLTPTYAGGDITGFSLDSAQGFFDENADSPGSRDVAEIVDADDHHRLVFSGSGRSTGAAGLYKLAVTTVAAGLSPASQSDWADASDQTQTSNDDQLLPNNYATGDDPNSFMASVSSNLAGGPTAPFVVVAGFPVDKKLLAWIVTPSSGGDFSVSGVHTLSTAFGGGTGKRADASLSIANAPSGVAIIAYNEDATSSAPGLHVATVDTAGELVVDAYPQPSTSAQARHAVVSTDSQSRAAVLYADGAGAIVGTLFWRSAWLPTVQVSTASTPDGAWSISNVWSPNGVDTFGVYLDTSATSATTFSHVYWQ